jgi:glycerol-3-phosphate O-acyltransferase
MLVEGGPILRWLTRAFFGAVAFDEAHRETIRSAAAAGTPVYVVNVHSLLDYLYFNYAFLRYGLPLAQFANGVHLGFFRPVRQLLARAWRFLCVRRRRDRHEDFRKSLRSGAPTLLFLKRSRSLIQWGSEFRLSWLEDLVAVQREADRPLILLPLLMVWDPKPESYRPTFFDLLFGDPQAPGRLRKFLSFARNFRRARVQVGRPLVLRDFLTSNPDTTDCEALAARLRFALSSEFLIEAKAIRGPVLKGARRVVDEITRTPPFLEEVRAIAADEQMPPEVALAKARAMLKRMAADFRFGWLEAFALVLGILFQRLYKGIVADTAGLAEIREAARTGPIVLVPSHRSHIDYLLYSVVMYAHGLIPPHIAAGDNLSFWPMGAIFRHSGAFFIRRTARGNPMYQAVLRHYFRKLLKEGYWIEFFIEGTRSRSGKAISPKYGMLTMVVDAVASGAAPNAHLMPAAVTYEKVIEEASYKRESAGSEKARESLKGLAASAKVLGSRFGKVYVQFDHTVDLVAFLREQGVTVPLRPGEGVPRDVIRRLAHVLMDRINQCFVVTPHHVVAFALLTHPKRGMERERLLERVGFLVSFVAARGAILSDPVAETLHRDDLLPGPGEPHGLVSRAGDERTPSTAIGWALRGEVDDVLRILRKEKVVRVREYGDDWVIQVGDEGRVALDYYKNGMIHLFVPEAIVATSVLALEARGSLGLEALAAHVKALSRLFKFEFVFGTADRYQATLDEVLRRFVDENLLRRDGEGLSLAPDARETMEFFAGVIAPFVEAYRVVGVVAASAGAPEGDRELVRAALRAGRRMHSVGDIAHAESVSTVVFRNALDSLLSDVESGRVEDLAAAAMSMTELLRGN